MHHHHHGGGHWGGNWGGWNSLYAPTEYVPYPVEISTQEEIPWKWIVIGGLAGLLLASITGRR